MLCNTYNKTYTYTYLFIYICLNWTNRQKQRKKIVKLKIYLVKTNHTVNSLTNIRTLFEKEIIKVS